MRNKGFILATLALIFIFSESFSQKGITIRPYARLGINLLPPSMEDLEYSDGYEGADIKKNPMAVGAGSQFLLQRSGLGLGVDLGAGTLFSQEINYDEGTGIAHHWDDEFSVYILFLAEYKLGELFFIQGGAGPHIVPWSYEYYYDSNNYGDDEEYYSGVGVSFAIMAAAGTEIPLSDKVNLFLLGKLDGIFRYGLMLPLTVNVGLTFKL